MRRLNKANTLIPSYIQLKQILYAEIQNSDGSGLRLPSIRSLMKFHKVSQNTVEKALYELEKDGLIESKSSLGINAKKALPASGRTAPEPPRTQGIVGIEVLDMVNFAPRIVGGAKEALSEPGFTPLVFSPESDIERTRFFTELLLQNGAKGFIGMPHPSASKGYRSLRESRIPMVFVASEPEGVEADCVINDDELGGYLAARHLLERGHRKLLHIGADSPTGRRRFDGFKRALAEAGVKCKERMLFLNDKPRLDVKAIYERIREDGLSGVFAWNDVWAVELYWFLSGMGLSIPGDVALMGYDDSEIIGVSHVPLSTVAQPCFEIGSEAARLLLERIAGDKGDFKTLKLEPKLVIRGTT